MASVRVVIAMVTGNKNHGKFVIETINRNV